MSRPYVMTEHCGLQPDEASRLYVRKDWTESGRTVWRLLWARPGAESFSYAYGACSEPLFTTMREAVAHGSKRFGEVAKKWVFGTDFD